jgi:hypothetical protein
MLDVRAGFDPARLVFIDETCTTTNIGSEAAGNFYISQRVVPPFRAYLAGMVQTYPTRPVHWIVSFSEGGPNDIIARLNGQTCQKKWVNNHQSMVRNLNATGTERFPLLLSLQP